jgi:hypothetical protein
MAYMFAMACRPGVDGYDGEGIENWDVSSVTNMEGMFYDACVHNP